MKHLASKIVARTYKPGGATADGQGHVAAQAFAGACAAMLLLVVPVACTPGGHRPATTPARRSPTAVRQKAVDRVLDAARSPDEFLRANAMETAIFLPERADSLLQVGFQDSAPVVRFAALATMGRLKLTSGVPSARRLLTDRDPSVRAAALFALGRCGEQVDPSSMAFLMTSPDPGARGNVAMLVGMAGDPAAIPLLKDAARVRMRMASPQRAAIIRMQIAEAVVKLGDEESIDAIEAGAFSQFDEVRVLAVMTLGRLKDRRMEPALVSMLDGPPIELQVASAQALAEMNHRGLGLDIVLKAASSATWTVRVQAAAALGYFSQPQVSDKLATLLDDTAGQVRISAAAAVLRRFASASTGP